MLHDNERVLISGLQDELEDAHERLREHMRFAVITGSTYAQRKAQCLADRIEKIEQEIEDILYTKATQ